MNGEIKVAVCDDLEEDRQVLVNLLSEYTDKNNLYVKIQEFTSGEAFLASDTSEYSLAFYGYLYGRHQWNGNCQSPDRQEQPGADCV